MPEFVHPFSGVVPDRKLTPGELTRALRLSHAAELEAIHLYEALADATDDALAAEVLRDIANEERVHAGEFQQLLRLLLPDEEPFLQEGAQEVEALRARFQTGAPDEAGEPDTDTPPAPESPAPSIGSLR